jgi:hypothetical protein
MTCIVSRRRGQVEDPQIDKALDAVVPVGTEACMRTGRWPMQPNNQLHWYVTIMPARWA